MKAAMLESDASLSSKAVRSLYGMSGIPCKKGQIRFGMMDLRKKNALIVPPEIIFAKNNLLPGLRVCFCRIPIVVLV